MRDFPVPEEFTMLAYRAYMFFLTRYTEIVSKSTFAALPLNSAFQEFTVAVEALVTRQT